MHFEHTNRPGFLIGFVDFLTAGTFLLVYMQLGLQDELDEILGRRTQRYYVAYLLGIPTLLAFINALYRAASLHRNAAHMPTSIGSPTDFAGMRPMILLSL